MFEYLTYKLIPVPDLINRKSWPVPL